MVRGKRAVLARSRRETHQAANRKGVAVVVKAKLLLPDWMGFAQITCGLPFQSIESGEVLLS